MKKVKRTAALIAAAMLAVMITGCSTSARKVAATRTQQMTDTAISTMLHTLSVTQLEIFSDNQ